MIGIAADFRSVICGKDILENGVENKLGERTYPNEDDDRVADQWEKKWFRAGAAWNDPDRGQVYTAFRAARHGQSGDAVKALGAQRFCCGAAQTCAANDHGQCTHDGEADDYKMQP
jgi:hypothetical protein